MPSSEDGGAALAIDVRQSAMNDTKEVIGVDA